MKIQDLIFLAVLVLLFLRRQPRIFVISGLVCLAVAIPLFHFWIFFTAERLTWYAASFFLFSLLFSFKRPGKVQ